MTRSKKLMSVLLAGTALTVPSIASAQLDEVVVTAQKREQSLNDIGIAVTAFSGDDIQQLGLAQPIDLAGQTPGLSIGNALGSSNPAVTVRGVGINDFNTNTNPGVAMYVDEIYQPIPAALSFGMFDIERVEVLKGPQGTLYGRNATGGAIGFVTKKPTDELDGFVTVDYGNYDYKNIEAAIGGGLGDRARVRLSGMWTDQGEGHQDVLQVTGAPFTPNNARVVGDHGKVDRWALRGQFALDVTDTIEALLSYTYGKDESDSLLPTITDSQNTTVYYGHIPDLTTLGVNNLYYYSFFGGPAGQYNHVLLTDPNDPPQVDMESHAVNLKVDWDLGFATLTSVTGYIDMDHLVENDFAGVENVVQDIAYGGNVEQISEELRLTSNEGELVDWIVGLYYSKTEQENSSLIRQDFGVGFLTYYFLGVSAFGEPIGADSRVSQEQTSIGLFAHTEWNLTDQWKLTVAGRWSRDELEYDSQVLDTTALSTLGVPYPQAVLWDAFAPQARARATTGIIAQASGSGIDEDSFTWKVGLDYQATDDVLLYGHVSTGFKNHGFYGGLGPLDSQYAPYQAEEILAYEIGFKSTLADGTLQLNGAAYQYTLDDPQVIVSEEIGLASPNDVLWNVAEAQAWGAELDLTWVPVEELTVRFGAGYLDSEISDAAVTGKVLKPGFGIVEGEPSAYSPEWTFNGLIRYEVPMANGLLPYIQTDFDYRDDATAFAGRPDTPLESRLLVNARIGITNEGGQWEAALWGKNLGDEKYSGYTYQILGPMEMHQAPRTYGVSLTYNFGQ